MATPQQNSTPHRLGLHGEVICNDGLAQCATRRHPVPNLRTLQTVYHKLRHWERVQAPRHRCSKSLQATLQQPDFKRGVLHELGTIPTSKIVCKSLCQNMRTSMQRHDRFISTSSIQNFGQNSGLQGSFGAESAQRLNTNTVKYGPFPCLHEHPSLWPALLELDAALPMCLHLTEHTKKDAGVHPVQKNRLKHSTNKPMHIDT